MNNSFEINSECSTLQISSLLNILNKKKLIKDIYLVIVIVFISFLFQLLAICMISDPNSFSFACSLAQLTFHL